MKHLPSESYLASNSPHQDNDLCSDLTPNLKFLTELCVWGAADTESRQDSDLTQTQLENTGVLQTAEKSPSGLQHGISLSRYLPNMGILSAHLSFPKCQNCGFYFQCCRKGSYY